MRALRDMLGLIRHRGPDDEGLHGLSFQGGTSAPVPASAEGGGFDAGFAFARLSIRDLSSAGHQPMATADGKVVLVFNGEIYNADEQRARLMREGAPFRGHSDTEVILQLYEKHGWDGLLARLRGMFALAIADLRQRRLHVARDHFGIKPLYWWQGQGVLLLASEIKAFLAHPAFRAELETAHLAEHLTFRHCAWDRTLLRGVRQLPPGHTLAWEPDGEIRLHRYWQLPDAKMEEHEDVPATVRSRLQEAVRSQLVSDVPLGAQLSGGIDSSLVTLDAARASTSRMHSFSIVFSDSAFSEDAWIDTAARAAGAHSHRFLFSPGDFARDFEAVTWHLDGPPGNPNTLALHLLAAGARQSVKVLLTGEGCDEVFAGYNRFYYAAMQARHPGWFKAGALLCGRHPQGRWWRIFGLARESHEHQTVASSAYGAGALLVRLMPDAKPGDALGRRLAHLESIPGASLDRQIRYEAETYLPDLLLRQDKVTMAHGVECRVPFLDLDLVALARRLPSQWLAGPAYGLNARMRGTKRVIKEIARQEFGTAFAYRRKRGFDVPLAAFFARPELRTRMEEQWLPDMKRRGLVDARAVDELWQAVLHGTAGVNVSAAEAVWVALGLEVWASQVLDGTTRKR